MTLLTLFLLFGLCVIIVTSLAFVVVDLDVVLQLLLAGFVVPVLRVDVIKTKIAYLFLGLVKLGPFLAN